MEEETKPKRRALMLPGAVGGVVAGALLGGLVGFIIAAIAGVPVIITVVAFAVGGGATGGVIGGFGEMRHVERIEEPEALSDEAAKPHPHGERPVDRSESGKGMES